MMSKKLLFLLLGGSMLSAQTINETNAAGKTGINTDLPTRTLTIQNPPADQGKPVLRLADLPSYSQNVNSVMDSNLGGNAQSSTSYFDYKPLVVDEVGDVYLGLPITNNTSIISLTMTQSRGDWVKEFNTGIDYNKYAVALMSYSFKLPDATAGDKIVMLTSGGNTPNKKDGDKIFDRIVPATVNLYNKDNKWFIEADYDSLNSEEFTYNEPKSVSRVARGTWYINLLVAPRELIHFTELEYDQGGTSTGTGRSDATYNTNLDALLNKISHN
ncbi:MAG: hypothetical protein HG446_001945 [Flavobacteriaceae bacterium]|nr:hypothetical protein [Flavobacteriaceae bacterium]